MIVANLEALRLGFVAAPNISMAEMFTSIEQSFGFGLIYSFENRPIYTHIRSVSDFNIRIRVSLLAHKSLRRSGLLIH